MPVQGPRGVWRFRVDGTEQAWRKADELPDGDLFPWCGIHPVTGVLYTINYGAPKTLFAYDRQSLDRRPADDVALEPAPIHLDRVQGGVFTKRGRLILVRSDYNAVFCYSSLNGHCFGASGSATSDLTFPKSRASPSARGVSTALPRKVHILELDNDASKDDFYLHSFQVPQPLQL